MSEEIQVIDLAPVDNIAEEPAQPAPEEAEPSDIPPLAREESVVLAPVPEEAEAPKPKRRGRPPGSRNKPKPKPPPPIEDVQDIEEEPRPPTRRVQMQAPDPNLEMAQTLLNLMHAQAGAKANKRRQLYQSWF